LQSISVRHPRKTSPNCRSEAIAATIGIRLEDENMKRSTRVRLVLLGSAVGLYACDGITHDLQQQRYTSIDQCRHDWGDPADCKPAPGVAGTAYYYGPRYYWDPNIGRPIAVSSDGSTRVISNTSITSEGSRSGGITARAGSFARGGFGSSAHGFGGS
jgi:hypothetical protein